jgi:hypothetical protein
MFYSQRDTAATTANIKIKTDLINLFLLLFAGELKLRGYL